MSDYKKAGIKQHFLSLQQLNILWASPSAPAGSADAGAGRLQPWASQQTICEGHVDDFLFLSSRNCSLTNELISPNDTAVNLTKPVILDWKAERIKIKEIYVQTTRKHTFKQLLYDVEVRNTGELRDNNNHCIVYHMEVSVSKISHEA